MDAAQISGNQRCRVYYSVWAWWCAHYDAWHACNTCRCRQHVHHRGKSSFSSRHIQSYAANGRDLLSSHHTGGYLGKPLLVWHLPLVKRAHVTNGVFNSPAHWSIKHLIGAFDLFTADT